MGLAYGIDGSKNVKDLKPFTPTDDNPFNRGYLTKVVANVEFETKNGVAMPRLEFHFRDRADDKATREAVMSIYAPDEEKHRDMMNDKIQTIFITFAKMPAGGLGAGAEDFEGFIKQVEKDFNGTAKKDAVFANKPIWFKLTARKGYLNLPVRNFMELYNKDKPTCGLILGPKETVEVRKTVTQGNTASSNGAAPVAGGAPSGKGDPFDDFE